MNLKYWVVTSIATSAVLLTQAATPEAQAAVLGGSNSCTNVSFTYLNCAGSFGGNDKGAQGSGLNNLNGLFGAGWTFAGDNEDNTVSFLSGGDGAQTGSASTSLSGFGAVAVKAGNSYSLYTIADLANFDWSTTGVATVGNGKTPGLSHLSVYTKAGKPEPEPTSVPEPGMIIGLVGLMGIGSRLKRQDR